MIPMNLATRFAFCCSKKLKKKHIQFLKQGPAYEKEGTDPNKGSNQQQVKI